VHHENSNCEQAWLRYDAQTLSVMTGKTEIHNSEGNSPVKTNEPFSGEMSEDGNQVKMLTVANKKQIVYILVNGVSGSA